MKMFTNFTRVLSLAVALTLIFGFISCSDDDDFVADPNNPAVVKLPIKIFASGDDEDGPTISVLEYNDQNQVVKVINYSAKEDGSSTGDKVLTQSFTYDEKGRLATTIISKETNDWEEKNVFTYNETEGYVQVSESYGSGNSQYSYKIYIDKNGCPVVKIDATEGYVKLAFDKNFNLLTSVDIDIYQGTSYKYTVNQSYATAFSPYLNLRLPAWFWFEGNSELPFYQLCGGNFPKSGSSTSTATEKGKEEKITETSSYNVAFVSTSDNYPIKIVVKGESQEVGEEKEPFESNYTIEYKTVEKK